MISLRAFVSMIKNSLPSLIKKSTLRLVTTIQSYSIGISASLCHTKPRLESAISSARWVINLHAVQTYLALHIDAGPNHLV